METTICDITAFDYWRIPPIVHMLLAGDEGDPVLRRSFTEAEIVTAREEIANVSLCKTLLRPSSATRNLGQNARSVLPAITILAANHVGPIDLIAAKRNRCHASNSFRSRLTSSDLPLGSTRPLGEYVQVTSPAFTLLQLAKRASLVRTIMLATEQCGSFAVFSPPGPIRTALENAARRRSLPTIGGWDPFITPEGRLTNLWSRPALTTPDELLRISSETESRRGSSRLSLAASLTTPGAASPFEAQAGIMLGLSRRRGGEGYPGFTFNKRIGLSPAAQTLAQRSYCVCDLYWEDGLDVECQSIVAHNNASSFLSDSDRTAALKSMGIDVLPITFGQLQSEKRFDTLSKTIASLRGVPYKPKTTNQENAARALRTEVFSNWETIHII